jgi:hypothetical protein
MSKEFDAGHDAILAKRKPPDTMITSRTQPTGALVALNHRWILCMVATVRHFLNFTPQRFLRVLPDFVFGFCSFC